MPLNRQSFVNDSEGEHVTFNGFSHYTGNTSRVAHVIFDGEPELYDIDANADVGPACEEIRRMYYEDYWRGPESIRVYALVEAVAGVSAVLEPEFSKKRAEYELKRLAQLTMTED